MATASYTTGVSEVADYAGNLRSAGDAIALATYVADPYSPYFTFNPAGVRFPAWTNPGTISSMTLTLQMKYTSGGTAPNGVEVAISPGNIGAWTGGNTPDGTAPATTRTGWSFAVTGSYASYTSPNLVTSFNSAVSNGWSSGNSLCFYFWVYVPGGTATNRIYLLENNSTAIATLDITYTVPSSTNAVNVRRGMLRGVRRGTRRD